MTEAIRVDPALLRTIPLPDPDEGGGKEERGRLLIVGGSRELPGAALLAATAALRAGAGKLEIATAQSVAPHLGPVLPEALIAALPETARGSVAPAGAGRVLELAAKCRAVLIGPGLAIDDDTADLTRAVLDGIDSLPIVLDAAAMMRIADHGPMRPRHPHRLVITPHSGEMAGILGIDHDEIRADPAGTAVRSAEEFGAVVVLKGRTSFIAAPDGRLWRSDHGNVGLATSGSGDTLAGIMVGLLARGAEPHQAAIWSVFAHAEAGNRLATRVGPIGYLAREIPGEVPAILHEFGGPAG